MQHLLIRYPSGQSCRQCSHEHESCPDPAENQTVYLRGHLEDILEHKGGAGQIGEEPAEHKTLQQAVTQEIAIPEQLGEFGKGIQHAGNPVLRPQSFPIDKGSKQQDKAYGHQSDKHATPSGEEEELSADDGSKDGRQPVHHHQHGKEFSQFRPFADIAGNGLGHHNAAGSRKAHEKAEHKENHDIISHHAAQRSEGKDHHPHNQWLLASIAVTHRPDEDLPQSHDQHGHGEGHLCHRSRNAKIRLHDGE